MPAATVVFFASHAAGGVRVVHSNIAQSLSEQGYDCELRALYPFVPEKLEGEGLHWRYFLSGHPHSLWDKLRMIGRMASWLRRGKPPLIVSAMPAANLLVTVMARLLSPSSRVILTYHETTDFYRPALALLNPLCGYFSNVKAIVAVSDAVAASLSHAPAAFQRKLCVITNALPPEVETLVDRLAIQREGRTTGRSVVSVVRLSPEKNVDALIDAAAAAPGFTCRIIGSGPHAETLVARSVAAGLEDRIAFLGQHSREEALGMVAESDIFVQMSLVEGHSLALIEAGRMGLPLIVSDIQAQRDAVTAQDGTCAGIVLDPHDSARLGQEINRLLDDPAAYAQASDAARRLASESRFEPMVDRYRALVDRVLGD